MSDEAVIRIIMQEGAGGAARGSSTSTPSSTAGLSAGVGVNSTGAANDRLYREMSSAVVNINKGFTTSLVPVINKLEEIRELLVKDYEVSDKEYKESQQQTSLLKLIGGLFRGDKALAGEAYLATGTTSVDRQILDSTRETTRAADGTTKAIDSVTKGIDKLSTRMFPENKEQGLLSKLLNSLGEALVNALGSPIDALFGFNNAKGIKNEERDKSISEFLGDIAEHTHPVPSILDKIELNTRLVAQGTRLEAKGSIPYAELAPDTIDPSDSNRNPIEELLKDIRAGTDKILLVVEAVNNLADRLVTSPTDTASINPMLTAGEQQEFANNVLGTEEELVPPPEMFEQPSTPQAAKTTLGTGTTPSGRTVLDGRQNNLQAQSTVLELPQDTSNTAMIPISQPATDVETGDNTDIDLDYDQEEQPLNLGHEQPEPLRLTQQQPEPPPIEQAPIVFEEPDEPGPWDDYIPPTRRWGNSIPEDQVQQMRDMGIISQDMPRNRIKREMYDEFLRRLEEDGSNPPALFAHGGSVDDHPGGPQGTDTIPAWLTKGEFVVNADAAAANKDELEDINGGKGMSRGGSVDYLAGGGIGGALGAASSAAKSTIDIAADANDNPAATIGKLGSAISSVGDQLMAVNPMIGGFAKGLGMAGEALSSLMTSINEVANRYGDYSPQIAQAQAVAEIRQTMGDFKRAQELGTEMSKFIIAQSDLQQKFEDAKIKLLMKIVPVVTSILEAIDGAMSVGSSITDAILALVDPVSSMSSSVGDISQTQRDQRIPDTEDPASQLRHVDMRSSQFEGGNVPTV